MRHILGMLALMGWAGSAHGQTLTEVWRLEGFTMPESAYFDEATGQIIVSQIGTFGPEAGADGKLSLVSPEGEMIDAEWVTGLIDPKGMASSDGKLYVADANGLQVVDMATGELSDPVEMPGAMMLNDVTVGDDGTIYVSDMFAGGIYRLQGDAVDQVVAAGGVSLPNGILAHDGSIIIGSFGDEMAEDFSVTNPGGLLTLDPASGTVTPITETDTSASVDGIAALGDWVVYDDNPTGRILGWRDGTLTPLGETAPGAADLGVAGDLLVIPFLSSGEVVAYRLE